MKQNPGIAVNTQPGIYSGMAVAEIQRQQERQETLKWISINALTALRSAWCEARSK
jgi:hypothetical protein